MRALVVLACLLFLFPETAFAHAPLPGMEGFYRGLAHPIIETAQSFVIVVTGLFIGQQPIGALHAGWIAFAVAFALGLGATLIVEPTVVSDATLFALALIGGAGVAVARRLPQIVSILLASSVGLAIGIRSMPDPGPWRALAFTLGGTVVGVNLLVFYALGAAHWIGGQDNRPWLQIGLRILGSWIFAASALMLALAASST